jgi:hypothetical protein
MTATATVSRASHSNWLAIPTRAGFVGYGLLHLAVAWLAIQIVIHHSSTRADQAGAFRLLEQQPAGRVLLIVIVVGLCAMALWQLLLAVAGHREQTGKRRAFERVASGGRVVIYAFLAWTALRVLQGSTQSSASTQEKATAGMLGSTGGRVLVTLVALLILGIGIGMIVYGAKRKFESKLMLGRLNPTTRTGVVRLGQFGYIARGVAFGIVGGLMVQAALSDNAARSRGLDGALRTLAGEPLGGVLLAIVAIGFAAFGVYCFFQAKYRRI